MARTEDGCGGKHLRLALAIIGLVAVIVFTGALYAAGIGNGKASADQVLRMDERVRQIEKDVAEARADRKAMLMMLDRIEKQLAKP